jgi:hypothetical protein
VANIHLIRAVLKLRIVAPFERVGAELLALVDAATVV